MWPKRNLKEELEFLYEKWQLKPTEWTYRNELIDKGMFSKCLADVPSLRKTAEWSWLANG